MIPAALRDQLVARNGIWGHMVAQLRKDLNLLDIQLPEWFNASTQIDKFFQKLSDFLQEMTVKEAALLAQLLYRIDVDPHLKENEREILFTNEGKKMAYAILKRTFQKVLMRLNYTNK